MKLYDLVYDRAVRVYGEEGFGANVVFDAGHVYWHLMENNQLDVMRVVLSAVPSIRPPFDHMWVEIPTTKRRGVGLAVSTWPCNDWRDIRDAADRLTQKSKDIEPTITIHTECPVRPVAMGVRVDAWIVGNPTTGTCWVRSEFFGLSEAGEPCGHALPGEPALDSFLTFSVGTQNEEQIFASRRALVTWMFAMGLLHCKNVTMIDGEMPPTKVARKQEKTLGRPLTKFKTLEISTPKPSGGNTDDSPAKQSSERAYHICRGHFATYTDDRPLFGRVTGTFWRPAHVRGSAEAGTVYKDYRVKGGA